MWRLLLSRPYPEDYKIQAATDKDFRNLLRVYMAGNTVYVEGEELELIYLRVTDPSSIAGPSDIVAFNVNSGGAVDLSKTWEDVLAQISEAGNGITNVINLYGQYWDLEFDEGSLPGGLGGFTNPFQGITITSGSIQELKIRSNHVTLRDCDVTNLTIYGNNVRVFDSYGKNVSVESSVTVPVKFFDCLIDQLWGGTRTDLVGTVVYFPY
jgi:hypothetical protein